MSRPSLNHCYRLIWNEESSTFAVASEHARRRGKGGKRCRRILAVTAAVVLAPTLAFAAPTGGVVTSGSAAISSSGTTTSITQSTQKASINWLGFSIAAGETVNFKQPNASAITLNRVVGNEKSVIDGALTANGKVFLINSNGVLFSKGSSVIVGGLVASTQNLTDKDFNAGKYVFKGSSTASVINQGTITASDGGYVALLGSTVSNQGVITATKGTVALASGDKITLNFSGDALMSVTVDEGTLNALVENKEAIYADGGTVILTAKAADSLIASQVNNSGIIQAHTIGELKGSISLYAHGGATTVDGTLDASAPSGGDGGNIETSGTTVNVADTASITTLASSGNNGTWLIDPTNFTISYGSGTQTTSGIGATTLATALGSGNVAITTASSGTQAGDINIDAPVSWTAANTLTLTAAGDINANAAVTWSAGALNLNAGKNVNINATLAASGTGNFSANWGSGTNSDGTPYSLYMLQSATDSPGFTGMVNLSSTGTGTVTLNGTAYTVIRKYADLAKVAADPTGHYVLGATLYTTSSLTGALGSGTAFTGVFEGLGNSIFLSYDSSTGMGIVGSGLFDTIGSGGLIRNLKVTGSIQGTSGTFANVGGLANDNKGTILNSVTSLSYLTTQNITNLGGLVGLNEGVIQLSACSADMYAYNIAGGLVGTNAATGVISLSNSRGYWIGDVTGLTSGVAYVGGLVGVNYGSIDRSYTSEAIRLADTTAVAGGLVGLNSGTIDQSYVTHSKTYTSYAANLAGFVGVNTGKITNSYTTLLYDDPYAIGTEKSKWIAGFAYKNSGTIANCYATTYSYDTSTHAGFVYDNTGGTTTNDYWTAGLDSAATAYTDNSTAKQLTATQAADFTSYTGFSSDAWTESSSGYPILKNTVVYLSGTGTYGSLADYTVVGLQGGGGTYYLLDNPGDTSDSPFKVLDSSGYIDAGYSSANSVLGSSIYTNLKGVVTVAQKALTLGVGSIADKTYDGTNTATQGTVSLVGLVGTQTLSLTGLTGTFSDANAGTSKTVAINSTGYTLSDGTGKASNYKLGSTTTTATITPKALTASSADVSSKTYDGTTSATVNGVTLSGIIGSDAVALSSCTGNFTDKNAGNDKSVVISGAVLSGSSAGNYTVSSTPVATTADITPRTVELYASKAVDGSTTVSASQIYVKNAVVGDTVPLSGSVTIGSGSGLQAITSVSGLSTSNANYTVVGAVGSVMVGAGNLVVDKVASGTATVSTTGTATTVTQTTDKAVIDWLRFSVASGESLSFVQPSSTSIVLNRVTSNEATVIAGALSANGKVFILNSNGVLFKAGSSVNVGGLVASTLDMSDSDFLNGNYVFTSKGGSGSLVDEGSIVIVEGGFLALVSENGVTANGAISAPGGKGILASAKALTLNLDATSGALTSYKLAQLSGTTTVGSNVYLRSGASNQATLEIAGSALKLNDSFTLSAKATDTLSISLPSLTVGSGGDLTGSWVNSHLASTGLALNAVSGNLTLNDAITWSSDSILSLGASKDIYLNKSITATGTNAGLVMNYGGDYHLLTPASYSGTVLDANGDPVADAAPTGTEYASITLSGSNASLKMNGHTYTLIHSLDQLDSLDQCINGMWYNPKTGAYDVSVTSKAAYFAIYKSYNAAVSGVLYYFNPATQAYDIPVTKVVNSTTYYYNPSTQAYDLTASYTGKLTRYYYDPSTGTYGIASYNGTSYWNPSTGQYDLAAAYKGTNVYYDVATDAYDKVAYNTSTGRYYDQLTGAYDLTSSSTGIKTYFYDPTSGTYDLTTAYASSGYYALAQNLDGTGTTYASSLIKNLTGTLAGLGHSISNLTITSTDTISVPVGGEGMITQAGVGSLIRDIGLINPVESFTAGSANMTTAFVGPLVGILNGTLSQAYVEGGSVAYSPSGQIGGLVGTMTNATIADCYSTLSGVYGGLVARSSGGSVVRSHATGAATIGGLIGYVANGTLIDRDYATGKVGTLGSSSYGIGGLIGQYNTATGYGNAVTNSFATGDVLGSVGLGGLIGYVSSSSANLTVTNCYATGDVSGDYATSYDTVSGLGGLIGYVYGGVNIKSCFATGNVTAESANVNVAGGLVGSITSYSSTSTSTITDSYATGDVTSLGKSGTDGGLVGSMGYTTITNSYATGDVTGYNAVGGLVGVASSGSSITDSYTTGLITATKGFGQNTVVGGIVGTGSITVTNSYYDAELNAGHVLSGYGNFTYGSSFHDASTGLDSSQMQDVNYYANGTISQVQAARAAEVAYQARQEAASEVAVDEAAQQVQEDAVGQDSQNSGTARTQRNQTRSGAGGSGSQGPADVLDQNLVFIDPSDFSADVRRIEVDGQTYILDDEENGKAKKKPAAK